MQIEMTLPALPFEAKPVRRVHRPDPETLWKLAYEEPVILTGCMDDWALLRELKARSTVEQKLAVLGSLFGEKPVSYHRLPAHLGGHYHFDTKNLETVTFGGPSGDVPFDAFAQQLLRSLRGESQDSVYLQSHFVEPGSPLRAALGPTVLPYLSEAEEFPRLWMGSPGQVVNLHYDDFVNFLCMLEGTKRVVLFSPDLLPFMYHAPFDRMLNQAMASHVRLLEPELERYPLFRQALREAQVAHIQPGEVLLTPPMWWHHVESFGLNVMVNNWLFKKDLELVVAMQENLTRAVRLFYNQPAERWAQARELYRRTVFAPGAARTPSETQEPPAFAKHWAETREMIARMPEYLRLQTLRYYEHFVFQVNGDPIPSQPGTFNAMVERNAQAPTFFLREE